MSDTLTFTRYLYSGEVQSVSLKAKAADGSSVVFFEEVMHPGCSYDLLDGHPIVEGWKALEILTPVANDDMKGNAA